jgi:hypothetical protein
MKWGATHTVKSPPRQQTRELILTFKLCPNEHRMINQNLSTGRGVSCGKKDTKSLAFGRMV